MKKYVWMKRVIGIILLYFGLLIPAWGLYDSVGEIVEWNCYYQLYKLSGYPFYNQAMNRYDFYDINNNYCGSLCYNNAREEWEYLGL
jgi:hypothetical protein